MFSRPRGHVFQFTNILLLGALSKRTKKSPVLGSAAC
jgi:hypothetical protein